MSKKPKKPTSVSHDILHVSVDRYTKDKIDNQAALERRSVSSVARNILEDHYEKEANNG
jgi:hypothetical protein